MKTYLLTDDNSITQRHFLIKGPFVCSDFTKRSSNEEAWICKLQRTQVLFPSFQIKLKWLIDYDTAAPPQDLHFFTSLDISRRKSIWTNQKSCRSITNKPERINKILTGLCRSRDQPHLSEIKRLAFLFFFLKKEK